MTRHGIDDLLTLMARLREPEFGCPWDLKQDYRSITPSTIEEVYEVVDAIERDDYAHLKEELGDLLFQIVFYGQLAKEEQRFEFTDVVHEITAKLLRRHPHVFPEGTLESRRTVDSSLDDEKIKASWEAIKKEEREKKGAAGILDDVPRALPAITRATKLQKRASQNNFDWPSVEGVFDKLEEEIHELRDALKQQNSDNIREELGDVLFSCINLSRHLKVEPEQALRETNSKFERRFGFVEAQLNKQGISPKEAELSHMESLWLQAKALEKQ